MSEPKDDDPTFSFFLSYHRLSLYLMFSGPCVVGAAYLEFGLEWKALRVLLFKIADSLMRNLGMDDA